MISLLSLAALAAAAIWLLTSFIPRDRWGSSAMAVALTGSIGALATYIGVHLP
jgi:hypothetical protein